MVLRLLLFAGLLFSGRFLGAAEPTVEASDLPRRPPTPPERALDTFRLKPGFRLELVAAEPLVVDPIALSFDESGNLFVLEMRDYSERRPERLGRVRRLVDTDRDGRFDHATVYVDDLPWPTALCCYNGGVFVGATPDLFFCRDENGDGVADRKEIVFTGFGSDFAPYQTNRLNVQAMLNNLTWGLDHRIHGSASYSSGKITSPLRPDGPTLELRGRDFSFDPRDRRLRAESGGGQHGLAFDNTGRKFICSNSSHCRLVMYDAHYADANPLHALPAPSINIAVDGDAAPVFRLSPDEPWRVIRTRWRVDGLVRGPVEGGGRPSGYFTAATGITLYRGNAFPADYLGDVFVADCGSNLIHRKKVREAGASLTAQRPPDENAVEFLASSDNWFRPVQLANGPDGALYVADMYREVIEHPWSLPESIKQHLDLNSGSDRGRIYRIIPTDFTQPAPVRLGERSSAELVNTLAHTNGWHRDTAARLLHQRQDRSVIPALRDLLESGVSPWGRLHALYALHALEGLTTEQLLIALADSDAAVRQHAIRLSESAPDALSSQEMQRLANDPSPRVRYQLAFTLSVPRINEPIPTLARIALLSIDDPWIRHATLHGARERSVDLLLALAADPAFARHSQSSLWFGELATMAGAEDRSARQLLGRLNESNLTAALPEIVSGLGEGLRRRGGSLAKLDSDGALETVYSVAARQAGDSTVELPDRQRAVRLLAFARPALAVETLGGLLPDPSPLQKAALVALKPVNDPRVASVILEAWPSLTPQSRIEAIDALAIRPERARALLNAVANGQIRPMDLDARQQQSLRDHPEKDIQARARAVLEGVFPAQRGQALAEYRPALERDGRAEPGRRIFLERCASCHRLGEDGHALGPDLATVGGGGWDKLLEQIIDPNREVAPAYVSYTVETRDGETYTGIIGQETETNLTLRQANGQETTLPRARIFQIHSQGQSLMPEGLETGLSLQDMADLLECLAPQRP